MIAAAPMIRAYHGDDQVALRRAFADDLKRWCGDNELGKEVLHLEEFDPARAGLAVLEACQTQSLFAEQRAVVVHEAERFPESALPELSKWLDDPTPGTALFLLFGKWDGRSRTAKRLAAVPDAVRAFDAPKPWEMAKAVPSGSPTCWATASTACGSSSSSSPAISPPRWPRRRAG